MWVLFCSLIAAVALQVQGAGVGAARLVCYVESDHATDYNECTHLIYSGESRGDKLDSLLKEYRKHNPRLKIILRVSDVDKELRTLLKSKNIQGLEIHDAHRTLSKVNVLDTVKAAHAALSASGGGPLFLALPAHPELLAKYYDFRELLKIVDLMTIQTHALGLVKKMTYHPSRLSGMWDMMNTDSVVDLVVGLGVPASKIVISLPATARKFTLLNETLSTPGSPTVDDEPEEIDQSEVCRMLKKGRWTLERDQDLSAPYAFQNKTWVSFEDSSSVDVKGKYARVRGLAGLALFKAEYDKETSCGTTLKHSLAKVLNQQSRAPRAAVLRSLENEILSASQHGRVLDALQVSPYRITQVVDSDGVIHSIREDTRTEFSCTRQGYFVHPRSCARFYRCVKFDQLSPDFTVFEFDCPAGLAFDSRYEVCVWPGTLAHSQACPGSSEIAPVPQTRFVCPEHEGYYVDPENCRWFFACIDHGKSPLSAYEFRCPFGLGFDAANLKCDWPWMVPACGHIGRYEAEAYGFSGALLTGAVGFEGKTADSVNVAAHHSLISGASLNNLVGVQGGYLSNFDTLDDKFITSQEIENGAYSGTNANYQIGAQTSDLSRATVKDTNEKGFIKPTDYATKEKYTSGSLILDDYRLPSNSKTNIQKVYTQNAATSGSLPIVYGNAEEPVNRYDGTNSFSTSNDLFHQKYSAYQKALSNVDLINSGVYIHDPTGDFAEPYKHQSSPGIPYIHNAEQYKHSLDSYNHDGLYVREGNGQYVNDNSGSYKSDSSSNLYSNTGRYVNGIYSNQNSGAYLSDSNIYTGAAQTLNAGAVNVGLVGKTTLLDAQSGSQGTTQSLYSFKSTDGHYLGQPAVSITHVGSSFQDQDSFAHVTTPIPSLVASTAGTIVTTPAVPIISTYKTTFTPEAPKTNIKEIFGITKPAFTVVQPSVTSFEEYKTPKIGINEFYEDFKYETGDSSSLYDSNIKFKSGSAPVGYEYPKPSIKFEDGFSHVSTAGIVSTTSPPGVLVSKYKPSGFNYEQKYLNNIQTVGFDYSTAIPVTEKPFEKIVAYTTGPSISTVSSPTVSTGQAYNQQTLHTVDSQKIDLSSNQYVHPEVDFRQTTGYKYEKPEIPFVDQFTENRKTDLNEYSKGQTESEKVFLGFEQSNRYESNVYQPQPILNQQITLHDAKIGFGKVLAAKPTINYEFQTNPVTYTTVRPVSYNTQTIHNFESVKSPVLPVQTLQYETQGPGVSFIQSLQPEKYSQQTINKAENDKISASSQVTDVDYVQKQLVHTSPLLLSTPAPSSQTVVSTFEPQIYSQQTIHNVDTSKIKTYLQSNEEEGYDYPKPLIKFNEVPQTVTQYPTFSPPVVTTYRSEPYQSELSHVIHAPALSTTALPKIKYRGPAVTVYQYPILKYTENVTPATYVEPTGSVYSSTYQPVVIQNKFNRIENNRAQFETVSPQPLNIYSIGNSLHQPEIQRDIENTNIAKTYSNANVVSHQTFHLTNDNKDYESGSHDFISSTPATINIKQNAYVPSQDEEVYSVESSTTSPLLRGEKIVIKSQNQYNTLEGQSNVEQVQNFAFSRSQFEQPRIESVHPSPFPGTKVITKYQKIGDTSPEIQEAYKSEEYLPPAVSTFQPVITERPFGITPIVPTTYSPRTYYKAASSRDFSSPIYNPPEYLAPTTEIYVSSFKTSTEKQEQSTESYQAPVYLPPLEGSAPAIVNFESFAIDNNKPVINPKIRYNPYKPKPVELSKDNTAREAEELIRFSKLSKSNLLGFGTVGPDAGLVSSTAYTTSATEGYSSSTLEPIKQQFTQPAQQTKPQIAIVTKINDFNPFIVRKLGAVCSCQSPVLVLKGRRPSDQNQQLIDDDGVSTSYSEDKPESNRQFVVKPSIIRIPGHNSVTLAPVTSTVNPIVVPDDSFYHDYEDTVNVAATPKSVSYENYSSSTPATTFTTQKIIRSRVKSVTAAPTYKSVLLNGDSVSNKEESKEYNVASINSQSFDRYGPGGLRGRDETLQGSVDCQRAGLFRHPKQCNKFYACRWDCTKQRFTLHVFNCPIQLSFDPSIGACNWPSQGPACQGDTLLTNVV